MSEARVAVFFYGLFMEEAVLRRMGLEPSPPKRAFVEGLELRLGERATLVPQEGEQAYGTVMCLTPAELTGLYAEPGLEDYRAQEVRAQLLDEGAEVDARCFVLAEEPLAGERNSEYARDLRRALRRLGLPVSAQLEESK